MEIRQLGNSELHVSSIGLGSVTFGREIDAEESFSVIDYAMDRSINLIDTAEVYSAGGSEKVLGQWLSRSSNRQKVVLGTKIVPPLGRERILQVAEDSLRRLQTDVIDLYQLHAFDANTPLEETMDALNTLVQQGKVRYLGCSNFDAWQICKALWIADVNDLAPMVSVQPNYSLAIRDIEAELLPFCADQNIGVTSYSRLGPVSSPASTPKRGRPLRGRASMSCPTIGISTRTTRRCAAWKDCATLPRKRAFRWYSLPWPGRLVSPASPPY